MARDVTDDEVRKLVDAAVACVDAAIAFATELERKLPQDGGSVVAFHAIDELGMARCRLRDVCAEHRRSRR